MYSSRFASPHRSVLLPPPPPTAPTTAEDTLLALTRQTRHLQRTLQSFLDAQGTALLAGLGHPSDPQDHVSTPSSSKASSPSPAKAYLDSPYSDNGSTAPLSRVSSRSSTTHSHSRPQPVVPVRQPQEKKVGLRGARKGLLRGMKELAAVKAAEAEVMARKAEEKRRFLNHIKALEDKKRSIEKEMNTVERHEGADEVERLKKAEQEVDVEIEELEVRLRELRMRKTGLIRRREERDNHVQARVSSWKEALRDVDGQMDAVLIGRGEPKRGVWALRKDRRTMELVKEDAGAHINGLNDWLESTRAEQEACIQGAQVWEEVVQKLNELENSLRKELGKLGAPRETKDLADPSAGMQAVLGDMKTTIGFVEEKFHLAEERDWKLLICCIGAELEALVEGRQMLLAALNIAEPLSQPDDNDDPISRSQPDDMLKSKILNSRDTLRQSLDGQTKDLVDLNERRVDHYEDEDEAPPDLLVSHHERSVARYEDDDDGPGPDLLVSHHDEYDD